MNFRAVYDEFLTFKQLKLKPQSFRSLKSRFESYILPYFENVNIENITLKDYINWQIQIESLGFKYSYKKQLHYSFVSLYEYLILFGKCTRNLPKIVGNFKNNELGSKLEYWTYEEFKKFENSFSKKDIVYKVFFILLFKTGLREGEALALTFNDIKNDILSITKTISKERYDGKKIISSPKSKSSIRNIRIDNNTLEYLNILKSYYKNKYGYYENNFNIFGGTKYLSITSINRKKNYYCEKCNLKKIRIHDFRHSHATLLLQNGINMIEVSRRLGHSDINITIKTYAHCEKEHEKRVIETLNSLH